MAVFKVKTLAVLFPPYPREMKTNTAKFQSAAILALVCFYGNGATLFIARAWLKLRTHLTAVNLWLGPTPEVRIHRLLVTLRMPRVKSDKSDWFWSQSFVFTKPFKTGMSLDLARGPDFQRMTKVTPGSEVEHQSACHWVIRMRSVEHHYNVRINEFIHSIQVLVNLNKQKLN